MTPEEKKQAQRETTKRYRARDPEKTRERNRLAARKRRALDPERAKQYQREYQGKNRETVAKRMREWRRLKAFGLTSETFEQMFEGQDRCCAICRGLSTGSKNDWHVDHCHKSGRVRGILCCHCNGMLAYAKDDVETLNSAIQYLGGD